MAQPWLAFLVIAPFDLAAFRRRRIARVAHIGRIALIAHQRPANVFAGTGKLVIGPEKGQRVIDRHHWQVLACHAGNETPPQPGANDDVIRLDGAAMGHHSLDAAILDDKIGRRCVGEASEFSGLLGLIDQLAGNRLRTRRDEARVGIPHRPLNDVFFQKRELLLGFLRTDHRDTGAEGLAGSDLALQFRHAFVIADTRHFHAAHAGVVAHLFEEIDGIKRRPAGQEIVAGRVTEVGSMRRRTDIGGHRGLVDADNIVPAALDQVMGDRGPDNTAETDDNHFCLLGKFRHDVLRLELG